MTSLYVHVHQMKLITAYIESNGKDLFSIYTEEELSYFVIGDGLAIEEAKADFLALYKALLQYNGTIVN